MRLAWLTDLHLDFVTPAEVAALAQTVVAAAADGVVVTGDIATGTTVVAQLEALAAPLACPVWFVLGNHDFYGASIASVRAEARALTQRHPHLRWLPATGVIRLDAETALVGHDGWGDGRLGDLAGTRVFLSDFVYIAELAGLAQAAWAPALGALGDEAAAALAPTVAEALTWARHVVVATHVPPFRDACCTRARSPTTTGCRSSPAPRSARCSVRR